MSVVKSVKCQLLFIFINYHIYQAQEIWAGIWVIWVVSSQLSASQSDIGIRNIDFVTYLLHIPLRSSNQWNSPNNQVGIVSYPTFFSKNRDEVHLFTQTQECYNCCLVLPSSESTTMKICYKKELSQMNSDLYYIYRVLEEENYR
jgi:hypothetical protein